MCDVCLWFSWFAILEIVLADKPMLLMRLFKVLCVDFGHWRTRKRLYTSVKNFVVIKCELRSTVEKTLGDLIIRVKLIINITHS